MQSSSESIEPFDGKVTSYSSLIDAVKSWGLLVNEVEVLDDSIFSFPTKVISNSGWIGYFMNSIQYQSWKQLREWFQLMDPK